MNDHRETHDEPEDGSPRKSRLDLEVDEILRRSDNVRTFRAPKEKEPRFSPLPGADNLSPKPTMPMWARKALETPLLLALGFAILSFVIADASPLLASLLALVAVIFVVLPVIQRFWRPQDAPETRMWRGRVIDLRSSPDSLTESLKRWWRSRKP